MLLVEPIGIAHSINNSTVIQNNDPCYFPGNPGCQLNKPNVIQNNDPCYVPSSPECKNLQSIQPKNSTDMIQ
jgi:hypothetical protein